MNQHGFEALFRSLLGMKAQQFIRQCKIGFGVPEPICG
jgi:hypothetical protein